VIPGQVERFPDRCAVGAAHGLERAALAARQRALLARHGRGPILFRAFLLRPASRAENAEWVLAETDYGEPFVSAVQRGLVTAVQFHPEKSGPRGLEVLRRFLPAMPPSLCLGASASQPGAAAQPERWRC
jgi:glutamine amidotransferase/cyclase